MSSIPTATLDLTGMTCPAPLLGAKKVLEDMESEQTLNLISNCTGTHDDLVVWCALTGNILASTTKGNDGSTAYLLQKSGGVQEVPRPDATLNMRGIACPGPILEAKRLLQAMKSGEVLLLVSDCTAAVDDIRLWSRETFIDLLLSQELTKGVFEFYLRKR